MSALVVLNSTARGNQPFTHVTQPWCRKQCFSPLRNSVRRECKVVCGLTVKQLPAGRLKRASRHGSQVADQPVLSAEQQTAQRHGSRASSLAVALAVGSILLQGAPAIAFTIHQEPENALSFPTWVIHISSVIEWAIAMSLVWKYAEVTGTPQCIIVCQPPSLSHWMVVRSIAQLSRQCMPPAQTYCADGSYYFTVCKSYCAYVSCKATQ